MAKEKHVGRYVLFTTQPFARYGVLSQKEQDALYGLAADGLNELARQIPIDVTLRIHPSDRYQDIQALHKNSPAGTSVQSPRKSLAEVLPDYDLVVGFTSTALLEAAAVGLPIIPIKTRHPSPLLKAACGYVATSASELASLSLEALRGTGRGIDRVALTDELGRIDGGASQRVADLCMGFWEKPNAAAP
jgi:hypothetical protein